MGLRSGSRARRFLAAGAAAVAAAGLAGCSSGAKTSERTTTTTSASSTSTTAASTTTTSSSVPSGPTQVSVYFISAEKIAVAHRTVPGTPQIGAAAMRALLAGPSQPEAGAGMGTTIPAATRFLGLDVSNGLATVNLSSDYQSGGGSTSMRDRLAQVVFTLTQFPTVTKVNFELDGKPVTVFGGEGIVLDHPAGRADFEDVSPAILVESPAIFETVASPVRVRGTANVFEARLHVQVVDWQGRVVADQAVSATSGTGTRGTFDVTIPFATDRTGQGAIVAYSLSAKDGSHVNVVRTPVQVSAA